MALMDNIRAKIIADRQTLKAKRAIWQMKGYTVVFTNGCFDILHPGHIHTLAAAADKGDILVVGLNSDASVQRLKGRGRPVLNEHDRALMLAAIHRVDVVVLFKEDTPEKLIQLITPDVLVKGGDYTRDTIVGADWVERHGGRVVTIPLQEGQATTSIIEKIKQTP